MSSYLISGPEISYFNEVKNIFETNNHSLEIYGNGIDEVNCESLDLPENAHLIINGHGIIINDRGIIDKKGDYIISLCSSKQLIYTRNVFEGINNNNKALDVELISCNGGSAINAISALAKWSTLITFISSDYLSVPFLTEEVITYSTSVIYTDNPFIKFASYIFINPGESKFAISYQNEEKIFVAPIDSYSSKSKTREWQNVQLVKYIEFCKNIKISMNSHRSAQIDVMIELVKDLKQQNEWSSKFNIDRYLELLLLNMGIQGNHDIVQELLSQKIDINVQLINGITPLSIAAAHGHVEVVRALLEAKALVDIKTDTGATALYLAAQTGYVEVVRALLEAKASVDIKTDTGATALCIAIQRGYLEIVKALINAGALVDSKKNSGEHVLYIAASDGNLNIIKALIEAKASVNLKTDNGISALNIAAHQGYLEVVKALIEAGASIDAKDNNGISALYIATELGHIEVIKTLIEAGASIDAKNNNGRSSLYIAAQQGHIEVIKTLIEAGASVDSKDNNGVSALYITAQQGHIEILKLFLSAGANTEEVDCNLMSCIKHLSKEIKLYDQNQVKYILKHNKEAKAALNAMKNLETQEHLKELFPLIERTENCLLSQPKWIIEDLNNICGENGEYYNELEL